MFSWKVRGVLYWVSGTRTRREPVPVGHPLSWLPIPLSPPGLQSGLLRGRRKMAFANIHTGTSSSWPGQTSLWKSTL